MTFVCLSSPAWPTAAGSLAELGARLLALAPRVALEPARGVAWADGRGLDAPALARRLLAELACAGVAPARAGVAATPVAAEAAARLDPEADPQADAGAGGPGPVTVVPRDADRAFLAPRPLALLAPPAPLRPLLTGLGLERCGDLAALPREPVEVRLGREGVALWRLARADDPRRIFGPRPRELPEASLDWADYALADRERLAFVVNALLGAVCDRLRERGEGATALTLACPLAGGGHWSRPVRSAHPTADRATWLRLVRAALERSAPGAPLAGAALRVDAAAPLPDRQGDLFDPGFATARAVEAALARVLGEQPDALAAPAPTRHPLPERRARWVAEPRPTEPSPAVRSTSPDPVLTLQLLPEPREVAVATRARRGFGVPVRYREPGGEHAEGGGWLDLRHALGPDCVSGGHWEPECYAREYYQCVRDDGLLVLLWRDALADRWYLGGWWE